MLYREAGQYKTSYAADMAVFPILQDRIGIAVILAVAFVVIPATGNAFLLNAILIPFLVFSLAAIGLNLLTGYTGLLSLGTGAFMGVGAYACYKLTTAFPNVSVLIWIAKCPRTFTSCVRWPSSRASSAWVCASANRPSSVARIARHIAR